MFIELEFKLFGTLSLTYKRIMNVNCIEELVMKENDIIVKGKKMLLTETSYENLLNYLTSNKLLHIHNNCIK